jgi:hypothetical protein
MRKLPRHSRGNDARASSVFSPREAVGIAVAIASFAPFAMGCLPGDTRPVPERVDVTAEPGQGLTLGIDTADGWRITFDRFLLALGNVDFDSRDPACNSYAEARYDRVFDFTVAGREKLGTAYGLGTCRIEFRLRAPSFDAILGPGATASDVTFMRMRGTDRHAEDDRVSVRAIGAAVRGPETKQFEWVFRRSYEITNCEVEGGGFSTTVELTEASSSELRIEVRPEELFRSRPDDSADLRFQPMADADVDADGVVTLDELSGAPPPVVDAAGAGGADAEAGAPASLESLVYTGLLPRVLRVAGGGPCEEEE